MSHKQGKTVWQALCLAGLQVICSLSSRAQTEAEIRTRFPGEQAVMLNHSSNYTITVQDGQPHVQSDETQQIMYLSASSGAYLSKFGFVHSSFHVLQQYEAYTRTAADKKIKVTDFNTTDSKSDGIFYDDVKETSFDFPSIAPGAVGTLHLTMLHKNAYLLSPFFFRRGIPVVNGELRVSFPKGMSVKFRLMGDDTGRIIVSRDTRHGENVYTFVMKDCATERVYEDAPDASWYSPHVVFFIEKYQDEKGRTIPWLASTEDLYRLSRSYLTTINKETSPALRHIVDSLIKGHPGMEERARLIYGWVQQHIKYVAFEQGMEGFIPRDANLVCSRRFGDCKDMSSILTVMLNTAGVPAYYTWIGTRSLAYKYEETPTPVANNHMISTILLNGQWIFLDGTDPTCIFGLPSQGIQDKEALIATGDSSYKIITVPVIEKSRNLLTDSTFLELAPEGLKGRVVRNMTGYFSMHVHGRILYTGDKDREAAMKNMFDRGSNKFRLDSFQIGDLQDKEHLRLTARFTLQDYARHIGDDWYLNMNLFKFFEHEEIDYPKRKMPIELGLLWKRKYVVSLKIPDDYQVSYLPKSVSYHNAVWGFEGKYEQKGNEVIYTQEFDNDHLQLPPEQFSDWNKVLEKLFPMYKETVGLSKK